MPTMKVAMASVSRDVPSASCGAYPSSLHSVAMEDAMALRKMSPTSWTCAHCTATPQLDPWLLFLPQSDICDVDLQTDEEISLSGKCGFAFHDSHNFFHRASRNEVGSEASCVGQSR